MTEMERNRVVELQHQGYGYKKISTFVLGIPSDMRILPSNKDSAETV